LARYCPYPHVSSPLLFLHEPTPSETSTLSLHDALPICACAAGGRAAGESARPPGGTPEDAPPRRADRARTAPACPSSRSRPRARDRKSTRLNSSHLGISYAVFCLKKKKENAEAYSYARQ